MEDERSASEASLGIATPGEETHPLLAHRLASSWLAAIERWIRCEFLGGDAAREIAEVRGIASQMMTG